MTPAAHYRMFGRYNAWANSRLYDATARLSTEQYRADRGAFFQIRPWHPQSPAGDRSDLDAAVYRRGRRAEPAGCDPVRDVRRTPRCASKPRIGGLSILSTGLTMAASPARSNTAASRRRRKFEQQLAPALAHWFNHQTHHRGHVHALLTGLVGAGAGTRSADFPAAVGKIRLPDHHENFTTLAGRVAAGDFAPPERMQQNCAFRCHEHPLIY